jgi:transposase-like protein
LDPQNYYRVKISLKGHFQAAFFAPASTWYAYKFLRDFIGMDGTHTSSRFRMQLLIAGGIDANDNTLPLSFALVPSECKEWWEWFLKHLSRAFPKVLDGECVFMLDREKGIPAALEATIPQAVPSHCCQHIADNVQTSFGVKCRPLF